MTRDREYEGKDLQAALRAAAKGSGIAESELDYKIIEQGRRGLFGLGAKNMRIRLMPPLKDFESEPATKPARREKVQSDKEQPERRGRRGGRGSPQTSGHRAVKAAW